MADPADMGAAALRLPHLTRRRLRAEFGHEKDNRVAVTERSGFAATRQSALAGQAVLIGVSSNRRFAEAIMNLAWTCETVLVRNELPQEFP